MSEAEYYASECSDLDIDRLADAGEFYLDESFYLGSTEFFLTPTQLEIRRLIAEGNAEMERL